MQERLAYTSGRSKERHQPKGKKMNDNFNTQFAALLTDSGMNEHIAPLQANIMGQLLAQNPQAVTILLQCIANGDTDGAKGILRELFETSTGWIVNHFNENAEEIHEDFMASN